MSRCRTIKGSLVFLSYRKKISVNPYFFILQKINSSLGGFINNCKWQVVI